MTPPNHSPAFCLSHKRRFLHARFLPQRAPRVHDVPIADESLKGLNVYAGSGAYEVEISKGQHTLKPSKRVPLIADIDPQTGGVSFQVDPARLDDLRK